MMKLLLATVFIFSLFAVCFSQKTVANLKPVHAAALEQFLSKNKDYQFLSEKSIDAKYLKFMREGLGKSLTPYYSVADFNHDNILDFALILKKKGKPVDQGEGMSKDHRYVYQLAIVIFNGKKKGGFTQAFIKDIEAPVVCFLNLTKVKKKKLYFGVYETDETFMVTPVGKGYIVEYFDEP